MEKKLTFQKFTEIASYEVYKALGKQYDVRNAVLKEIMPQCSAEIAVILNKKCWSSYAGTMHQKAVFCLLRIQYCLSREHTRICLSICK